MTVKSYDEWSPEQSAVSMSASGRAAVADREPLEPADLRDSLDDEQRRLREAEADFERRLQEIQRRKAELKKIEGELTKPPPVAAKTRSSFGAMRQRFEQRAFEAFSRVTRNMERSSARSAPADDDVADDMNARFKDTHEPPKQPQGIERRVFSRYSVEVEVTFSSNHNFYAGLSENISEGGVFIATFETFAVGTPLELSISLPDGTVLKGPGVVRWTREYNAMNRSAPPGIGVQFVGLPDKEKEAVVQFIKSRSTLLYDA
jgi:uncharacterized protein (TIGR02266 family)